VYLILNGAPELCERPTEPTLAYIGFELDIVDSAVKADALRLSYAR